MIKAFWGWWEIKFSLAHSLSVAVSSRLSNQGSSNQLILHNSIRRRLVSLIIFLHLSLTLSSQFRHLPSLDEARFYFFMACLINRNDLIACYSHLWYDYHIVLWFNCEFAIKRSWALESHKSNHETEAENYLHADVLNDDESNKFFLSIRRKKIIKFHDY